MSINSLGVDEFVYAQMFNKTEANGKNHGKSRLAKRQDCAEMLYLYRRQDE
jgi:hypothetical protein